MGGLNSGPHRSTRLPESAARRYDVLELQALAKAEGWKDGTRRKLTYRVPTTGIILEVAVEVEFTRERFGGRHIWCLCPVCRGRQRLLFRGRPPYSAPHQIACGKCQRLAYDSNREGPERRWRRQMTKIDARLGGDPRKIEPPCGLARRTFDRL